jgi:streptomycin 6-kinase
MTHVPETLARTIREVHGPVGERWLAGFPRLLEGCRRAWGIALEDPFEALSYNYVARATGPGGEKWVLKAGVPSAELTTEIEALRAYGGHGAVRLIREDAEAGAILLERLEPGTPLKALGLDADEEATTIAAGVMQRLWRPLPDGHPFPSVADWGEGFARLRHHFGGAAGPLPARVVERAEGLFRELLASAAEPVLLHGDLHHDNILRSGERWLAIDPKGLAGEPAYEAGAFLRNPLDELLARSDAAEITARRIQQLAAQLELDAARIRGWAFAQAILSAWWMIEDHGGGWEPVTAFADLLSAAAN